MVTDIDKNNIIIIVMKGIYRKSIIRPPLFSIMMEDLVPNSFIWRALFYPLETKGGDKWMKSTF